MEEAKTRNLYEVLGLTNKQADQDEIHLAYQKLTHKLAPGNNPVLGSADAVELSKVDPALLLADPPQTSLFFPCPQSVTCHPLICSCGVLA